MSETYEPDITRRLRPVRRRDPEGRAPPDGEPAGDRRYSSPTRADSGGAWPARGSLFARIFVTNALVFAVFAVLLILTPLTVSSPVALWEAVVIVGGLTVMLVIDLFVLRRTLMPLLSLTSLMRDVELLTPGRRIPASGGGVEVVELTSAFNEMLDRLESERRVSVRRALGAQESERRRISHELHDEVGQSLTAILLQLERLEQVTPTAAHADLEEAREAARAALEDVRRITRRLRPEALDDLGLGVALAALVERLSEQTDARIEHRIARDLPPITPEADLVLYRVAQEGLTNALRHAGAVRIELRLWCDSQAALLIVDDDGRGLDGSAPGTGIQGMKERSLLVGGELLLGPREGGGTRLRLRVPVSASEPSPR